MNSQPIIILMRPQMGENIGMSARAMYNCGLTHLRIVEPREGWPNPQATSAAKGARKIVDEARLFSSLKEASADCTRLFATSARIRERNIPMLSPAMAARELCQETPQGARNAVLFGPENNGLDNDSLAIADRIIYAEMNSACKSLNLAQAVFLVAWEWWKLQQEITQAQECERDVRQQEEVARDGEGGGERQKKDAASPATKAEMVAFLARLERELQAQGFFRSASQKPEIRRNLHALAMRARPTQQELRTLQGVISVLTKGSDGRGE